MFPPYIKSYLVSALGGTPVVLSELVADLPADSPLWDKRPDPKRFTIRELIAHLTDWEPVCRERIVRTREEEVPFLPNWDEDQAAIDGAYEKTDPKEELERFAQRRTATAEVVASLLDEEWTRTAKRENVGELSIERQVMLILAHDGYHLRQTVEYLQKAG